MPEYTVDTINIEAVKKAYIDGSLEIRPGYRTYWVGGQRKSGYVNTAAAIDLLPVLLKWIKEANAYRAWMEFPVCSHLSLESAQRLNEI